MSYLGYEVLDIRDYVDVAGESPLMAAWLTERFQKDRTHSVVRYFDLAFPQHRIALKFFFDDIADFATIRDFTKARIGCLDSFWLIYPFQVLDLTQNLAGTDASIKVRTVSYAAEFISSSGTFRHLCISDGVTDDLRKVASAIDGDTEDELTLDSALSLGATAKEDAEVLFLFLVRFDSDSFVSRWPELIDHAEMDIPFLELPRGYP